MKNFEAFFHQYDFENLLARISSASSADVTSALHNNSGTFSLEEAGLLLSPAAGNELETMAVLAQRETLHKFGKTVLLYIPLYLSNICVNACRYCGFSSRTEGYTLSMDQIRREAQSIYKKGFRHILLVAGDNPAREFQELLLETVQYLRPRFSSISLEIAPQTFQDYCKLVKAGVDGLTLYQETYHLPTYQQMHLSGPKADYSERLASVEYAADAGIRRINLGSLLGLYDWRYELLALYLHYKYLQKKYWHVFYSLSFPRLREMGQDFSIPHPVSDKELVQMILAARILMPEIGLVLSTRESPWLRDHLVGLGITQMSAGSSTQPGGYTSETENQQKQFEIADNRTVEEVIDMIRKKGYDPVWKDWEEICYG